MQKTTQKLARVVTCCNDPSFPIFLGQILHSFIKSRFNIILKSWKFDEETNLKTVLNIENRIYREEFNGKKCKTAILLYCFHTAGVLHIFMLYNLLGPGISFYIKSKKKTKLSNRLLS